MFSNFTERIFHITVCWFARGVIVQGNTDNLEVLVAPIVTVGPNIQSWIISFPKNVWSCQHHRLV